MGSCLLLVFTEGGLMPELPEVETVRTWLGKIDSGKEDFECRNSLSQDDEDRFGRISKGDAWSDC